MLAPNYSLSNINKLCSKENTISNLLSCHCLGYESDQLAQEVEGEADGHPTSVEVDDEKGAVEDCLVFVGRFCELGGS